MKPVQAAIIVITVVVGVAAVALVKGYFTEIGKSMAMWTIGSVKDRRHFELAAAVAVYWLRMRDLLPYPAVAIGPTGREKFQGHTDAIRDGTLSMSERLRHCRELLQLIRGYGVLRTLLDGAGRHRCTASAALGVGIGTAAVGFVYLVMDELPPLERAKLATAHIALGAAVLGVFVQLVRHRSYLQPNGRLAFCIPAFAVSGLAMGMIDGAAVLRGTVSITVPELLLVGAVLFDSLAERWERQVARSVARAIMTVAALMLGTIECVNAFTTAQASRPYSAGVLLVGIACLNLAWSTFDELRGDHGAITTNA